MSMAELSPAEATACRIAGRYAWRYLMTRRMFRDAVQRIESVDAASPHSIRMTYETRFGVGLVHVSDGTVEYADWTPLVLRRRVIVAAGLCGVTCAAAAVADYERQHAWFATYGHGPAIFALLLVASAAAAWCVAEWLLAAPARTPSRTGLPMAFGALLVMAAVSTAHADLPNGTRAIELLEQGDLTRAKAEADATRSNDTADMDAGRVMDILQLRAITAAASSSDAYQLTKFSWSAESAKVQALTELGRRVDAELAHRTAAGDLAGVRRLSDISSVLDAATQRRVRASIALLGIRDCLGSRPLGCLPASIALAEREGVPHEQLSPLIDEARSTLKAEYSTAQKSVRTSRDAAERAGHLADAITLAGLYRDVASSELEPGLARLRALHATATTAADREAREQAAETRREQERQARARARRAELEERQERARARASAPLRCCDGALSPSCVCGGSRQGCCSHHGGVCGCSQ